MCVISAPSGVMVSAGCCGVVGCRIVHVFCWSSGRLAQAFVVVYVVVVEVIVVVVGRSRGGSFNGSRCTGSSVWSNGRSVLWSAGLLAKKPKDRWLNPCYALDSERDQHAYV